MKKYMIIIEENGIEKERLFYEDGINAREDYNYKVAKMDADKKAGLLARGEHIITLYKIDHFTTEIKEDSYKVIV